MRRRRKQRRRRESIKIITMTKEIRSSTATRHEAIVSTHLSWTLSRESSVLSWSQTTSIDKWWWWWIAIGRLEASTNPFTCQSLIAIWWMRSMSDEYSHRSSTRHVSGVCLALLCIWLQLHVEMVYRCTVQWSFNPFIITSFGLWVRRLSTLNWD